jgi:hypothetical protein
MATGVRRRVNPGPVGSTQVTVMQIGPDGSLASLKRRSAPMGKYDALGN